MWALALNYRAGISTSLSKQACGATYPRVGAVQRVCRRTPEDKKQGKLGGLVPHIEGDTLIAWDTKKDRIHNRTPTENGRNMCLRKGGNTRAKRCMAYPRLPDCVLHGWITKLPQALGPQNRVGNNNLKNGAKSPKTSKSPPRSQPPPPRLVKAMQKSQINTVPTPTAAWTRP